MRSIRSCKMACFSSKVASSSWALTGVLAAATSASARPLGRHVVMVAVGVSRAGVGGIGKDVVHHRSRPPTASRTRQPRSGIQALEDLANAHLLLDEPAVEHPNQLCLTFSSMT